MCASSSPIPIKLNGKTIFVAWGDISPAVGYAPPGEQVIFYNLVALWDSPPLFLSTILHELIHKADEIFDIGLDERQTTKLGEVFGALLRENNWLEDLRTLVEDRELVETNGEETWTPDE
ncbi:MAG: hypothetical protein J3T61_00355 [Candidatus Brocadiales bacterium]|nr:hypothetical protein [Candidatus Bathyanammoxibius sp.]